MGSAQGSREVESETKEMRQGAGTGGNARGRAAAMRVVAALRALLLCGAEKCPFDFATDGDSAGSENKVRMDLLLSFSTADAVDVRSELTRFVRLEADRLVGRRPGGHTRRAKCDRPCPCGSCLVAHLQRDVQRHYCGGADRGAMSADE